MKVVHYSTSLSRSAGGLYYSVSGLAKAQAALGADVSVIGGADQYFEQDRGVWEETPLLPQTFRFGRYLMDPAVLRAINALQPDILHLHGIWDAASAYGRWVSRGTKVVVSPRGMLDPWILARKPSIKRVHAALFERPMLQRAYAHALNHSEREAVLSFMPRLAERTFVVPNGVDEIKAPPAGARRSGALYVSRVHPKKQTLELIEAWSRRSGSETLTVAGWGDPAFEQQVVLAAASAPNVEFVGSLYGEAKAQAFEAASFFILPSLSEGLPMAVLEALQHGCVPIITDECNLPELFRDDIAIRMETDFGDFAAVTARAFAMSEAERTRRSAAARAYSQRYLWSEIGRAMLAQYERILGTAQVA